MRITEKQKQNTDNQKGRVKNFCFLHVLLLRAIDGARTRGLDLGKVARYQLRHYRMCTAFSTVLSYNNKGIVYCQYTF